MVRAPTTISWSEAPRQRARWTDRRAPSFRSMHCRIVDGPLTSAMASCPSSKRWSAASSAPRMSSTAAEHSPWLLPSRSSSTVGMPASHQCHSALEVAVDRADENAVDAMLLEHAEVALLAFGGLVGRAEHQDVVLFTQHVLGAADYLGEERVRDVEEDHADRAALAHPQLVCCGVAHEPCRVDRIENPLAGGRGPRPKGC